MALCFHIWEILLLSMAVYSMMTIKDFSPKDHKRHSSIFYIYVRPTNFMILLLEIWNFVVEMLGFLKLYAYSYYAQYVK